MLLCCTVGDDIVKRNLAVVILLVVATAVIWYVRRPVVTTPPPEKEYPRIVKHTPVTVPTDLVSHKHAEPDLHMSDSFSAEFVYRGIELDGWHLSYTYAERTYQLSPNDFKQIAHYHKQDLRTVSAELTDEEVDKLIAIVRQSGFLRLEQDVYGEKQGRYYPYALSVSLNNVSRQVSYHSSPSAEPCPRAFTEVEDALKRLVEQKFNTKCD